MSLILFILFVSCVPIVNLIVPKILGDISIVWFVFYFLLIGMLINLALKPRFKFLNIWIFFVIAYSVIIVASISWSDFQSYNLFTVKRIFVRSIVPLFIAIAALNIFDERKNVYQFTKYMSISAFILSIISIYQLCFGNASLASDYTRAAATFKNPNALAIFLVLSIPSLLYCLEKGIIQKKIGFIIMAVIVTGIISTASRKGFITMGLAIILYLFFKRKFKAVILLSTLGVILFVIILSTTILPRFEKQEMGNQLETRWRATTSELKMVVKHPLIGWGYDGFVDQMKIKFRNNDAVSAKAIHNIFLSVLCDQGLLGFIPFMGMLLYPLFFSWRHLKKRGKSTSHQKDMAVICITSIIPFMLNGWFAGGLLVDWQTINLLFTQIMFVFSASM